MKPQLFVLWDIDGTLVRYREPTGDRFKRYLLGNGSTFDNPFPELVGTTEAGIMSEYLGTREMGVISRHLRAMDAEWFAASTKKAEPIAAGRETVSLLQATCVQTVVTGNTFLRAVKKLGDASLLGLGLDLGLGAYGEESTGRDQLVRLAMERARASMEGLGSAGCRFVCIGDTPRDARAAAAAGALSVLVATGKYAKECLTTESAALVLSDLDEGRDELLDFLHGLEGERV